MEKGTRSSAALGSVEVALQRSQNPATLDRLVFAARPSTGVAALVEAPKAVGKTDWLNTKWSVVRKGNEPYPQSNKFVWQVVDRRRLLLVGTHHAVFEIVLAEPTVNSDTNAFFPVRLKCEIGGSGLELLSKPFFVLHPEAIDNLTKFSLDALDKWFLNPDMGLISVIEISTVRSKSLAAAFLRKHSGVKEMDSKRSTRSTNSLAQEASPGSPAATATTAAADDRAAPFGVRAKFLGGDNAILFLIEKVYPVPVPIDDVSLLVAVSQIFHFTHESIHWVGDRATTDILFSNAVLAAGPQVAQDKLHVYGVVVPCKGMYQHSNPRLKKPFEVLCTSLKVILASNGLPMSWLENDGKVVELTDEQVKNRKFSSYDEVFAKEAEGRVFNANRALEALSRSVSITRNGGMCIDYSVVIPVLVNTLSELHSFFAHLENSKLRDIVGSVVDQLFSVQSVIGSLGREIAEVDEERARHEAQETVVTLASKTMSRVLKETYLSLPLHLTQGAEFDCFVPPTFDLSESSTQLHDRETEKPIAETTLNFAELVESDLPGVRLCIKGASGLGKTTCCRYIARQWAKSQMFVFGGKFDVVLLLSMEAATTSAYADLKNVTLVDMVMREIVMQNEDLYALLPDRQEVLNWLSGCAGRILWLLDGIDALESFHNSQEEGASNVSALLASLTSSSVNDEAEEVLKHRIVTTGESIRKTVVQADLYETVDYISKFFPVSEEKNMEETISDSEKDGFVTTDSESAQGYHSSNDSREDASVSVSPASDPNVSMRARKIWLSLEKLRLLAKDLLHSPMNLELVCASYLSDAKFHFGNDVSMSDLFDKLFDWLIAATEFDFEQMAPHLFKVAFNSLFKSKFGGPTLSSKAFNSVPRNCRRELQETRFFEAASASGQGAKFVHLRVQEYLSARHMARMAASEPETWKAIIDRLKVKISNPSYHATIVLLIGLIRHDLDLLNAVFDVVLMDEKTLGLLGPRGPSFVFICFDSCGFDRNIRSRLIEWFWQTVGKPRIQIWRSNFVVNLLELIIFKLMRAGASESDSAQVKCRAVLTLASLGMENARVMQIIVKAGRCGGELLEASVRGVAMLHSSRSLSALPLLLDALAKFSRPDLLELTVRELRRLDLVDAKSTESSSAKKSVSPPRSIVATAATKLIKIGMRCIERVMTKEEKDEGWNALLQQVLLTLAQWKFGDDSALPLLVKSLELENEQIRRVAIDVIHNVDLLGPNVYYNERVLLLLESIGRKCGSLRGDVVCCFVALGMDNEFVRQMICACLMQSDDLQLQTRTLLLCARYNLRASKVVETIAKLAREAENQTTRRIALDCLAFAFLVGTTQTDVNACIDMIFGLGISGAFASHRIARMAEKKSKGSHLTFDEFASKYIV